ncbi:MAG: hypothetical protein Q9170_000369 [Blastenia crenularia]
MWFWQNTVLALIASLHWSAGVPALDVVQQSLLTDQSSTSSIILESLKKAKVIPDVLDDGFTPLYSINITYPSAHKTVNLGNKIKPKAVSSTPDLIARAISEDDAYPTPTIHENTTYTFVLTDPDATSRSDPVKAEMCHWIVTGIPFNATASTHAVRLPAAMEAIMNIFQPHEGPKPHTVGHDSSVKELMPYFPPAPPPSTGYHRYVFVLLASKANDKTGHHNKEPSKPKERPHWGYGKVGKGVRDWAQDNGLTPVGANFFYAKNKKQ